MASDPESLATKLEQRKADGYTAQWHDVELCIAAFRRQPPVLSVEGLRARVEALRWTCYVDQPDATWACDQVLEILAAPVEATELDRLRNLCAEMYQVAGTLGADARVLDTLSAAANGQPLPHGTLLPYAAPVEARATQEAPANGRAWLRCDGLNYWVCVGPSTEDREVGRARLEAVDAALRAPQPAEPTREQIEHVTQHEACIAEMEVAFDASLEQALNRAEAAETQVATLTATVAEMGHARNLAEGLIATLTTELAEARADVVYHSYCRPNRKLAEAWRDDAKAMNDQWADEVKARRDAEHQIATLRQELAAALKLADSNLHPGRYPDPAFTVEGEPAVSRPSLEQQNAALTTELAEALALTSPDIRVLHENLERSVSTMRRERDDMMHERDEARANARILGHAYTTDNSPPRSVVSAVLAYPVRPEPSTAACWVNDPEARYKCNRAKGHTGNHRHEWCGRVQSEWPALAASEPASEPEKE